MRIPDNEYHKKARVQLIYAESLDVLDLYEIEDKDTYLHYELSATDVLVKPGLMLKDFLFPVYCESPALAKKMQRIQQERRTQLKEMLDNFEQAEDLTRDDLKVVFDTHFGYEQLIIDKTISEEKYKELLVATFGDEKGNRYYSETIIPYDGRTFFEESNIIRLKHLGYQMNGNDPILSGFNRDWYLSRAITRHRLYDILANYESIVEKVDQEVGVIQDVFGVKNIDDILKTIGSIRVTQMKRRNDTRQIYDEISSQDDTVGNLLEIIKVGLVYNEDVRLLRSRSFNLFSKHAIKLGENPKRLYREFQLQRQEKFVKQYRPEILEDIMNNTFVDKFGGGKYD